ncbi:hypothetical protein [Flavobacterium piscis]|uniref:Bacteriocin n=1 Tax=Flavobacterium piscis TaxID=1114874 RepID=A0ABU1Y8L4_9FLAO|nr:hypothetical protein [Flavobacterium piscis]MDR7210564.1 hypothetical protein [Flavobacterium piscis]
MKTNKRVVLGFAVAMVFSLAFMQGNTMKSTKQDINVQQLSVGAGYMAGSSEGGAAGAWGVVSAGLMGAAGAVGTTTTIVGWVPPVGLAGAALTGGLFL